MEKPLSELDGEFVHFAERAGIDVLMFTCPLCKNGHSIAISWSAPSLFDSGAIWAKQGDTIDNITLSPSINCDVPPHTGCRFHGWVRNGKVVW